MTKPISRDEAARLLKGLSNPYAVRRREDAKALARVTESNKQMVAALLALANNDPDFKVREAATATLNAPVHQPFVLDLQAEATAKQVHQLSEQEILTPAAEHSSAAQEGMALPQKAEQVSQFVDPVKWECIQAVKLYYFCMCGYEVLFGQATIEGIGKYPRDIAAWGAPWLKPHWELTYATAKAAFKFMQLDEIVDVELYPLSPTGQKGAMQFSGKAMDLIRKRQDFGKRLRNIDNAPSLAIKIVYDSADTIDHGKGITLIDAEGIHSKSFEDLCEEFNQRLSASYDKVANDEN